LGGPTGDKLMELLGIDLRTYVRAFRRLNLIRHFPGREGRGDSFPLDEARAAWWKLGVNLGMRRTILLGAKVAEVAVPGWRRFGWCQPFTTEWTIFLVVPHPSGLNLWWNDAGNTALAARALRDYCKFAIAECSPVRCHACGSVVEPAAGVPHPFAPSGGSCPMWHDTRRHLPEPGMVSEALCQVPVQPAAQGDEA
jgi:hypothetical protein